MRLGPDPSSPLHTVVGVVGVVILGPKGEPVPTVYASMRHDHWGGGFVVLRTSSDASVAPSIRRAVAAVDPPVHAIVKRARIRGIDLLATKVVFGDMAVISRPRVREAGPRPLAD